jgi:hypothetical protein
VREIRPPRSMRGVWKRSYGRATKAPSDERGGNRHARPNATAPHPDSTPLLKFKLGHYPDFQILPAIRREGAVLAMRRSSFAISKAHAGLRGLDGKPSRALEQQRSATAGDCPAFSLTLAEFERNRGNLLYRDGRGKTGSGSAMKTGTPIAQASCFFRDVFWLVIDSKNAANDLPHVMAATRLISLKVAALAIRKRT